jgi:hypothetical protein
MFHGYFVHNWLLGGKPTKIDNNKKSDNDYNSAIVASINDPPPGQA